MKKASYIGWIVVPLLAASLTGAALAGGLRSAVLKGLQPKKPFDAALLPLAPDYANDAAWSALPTRVDSADDAPDGHPAVDPFLAQVDVFYIHPTSYLGAHWNGPFDNVKLNRDTDRVATGIQASAFNAVGAVYAPRYRQTNGLPHLQPSPDGDRAIEVAYGDVRRAFAAFNERRGANRPFIVAGHSQGSMLGERLLVEEISRGPLRDLLVAAYLPGGTVAIHELAESAPEVPPCATPAQFGCVAAWNARTVGYVFGGMDVPPPRGLLRLCTNPLSWLEDGKYVGAEANLGAVFLETRDRSVRPAFADAQCVDGILQVSQLGKAPRDFLSQILDRVLGKGNYHPIEYQIYFMNLRQNVGVRAAAFRQATQR